MSKAFCLFIIFSLIVCDVFSVFGEESSIQAQPTTDRQSSLTTAESYVQKMISAALVDGGMNHEEDINTAKASIEALGLKSQVAQPGRKLAREHNQKGLSYLQAGQLPESLQEFRAAFQVAPEDIEIVNNLGFVQLKSGDRKAAEQTLLRALALAPGRANAWANLGQVFATQGDIPRAIACFANAYRFSGDKEKTRAFLQKLSNGEDSEEHVQAAAKQALQLKLVQTDSSTPPKSTLPDSQGQAETSNLPELARFDRLIKQYEKMRERIGQVPLKAFDNSLEVTLFHLKDMRKALGSFAFVMPANALVEVHPSALEAAAMPPRKNGTYWKTLENSLLGIGYVESGRSSGIWLMAKDFPDQVPKDAHVIMGGDYRGFFTLSNGDKFIPGIQFYEKVLDGRVKLDDLPRTDLYWNDRLRQGDELALAGKYEEALKAYDNFLQKPMAPNEKISAAYFNVGMIYTQSVKRDLDLAKKNFTEAIRYSPELSAAYMQRAIILTAKRQDDAALQDCETGLKYEKDPVALERINKLKQIILERRSK